MAVDKLVDSTQLEADLKTVADAIREKGGTSEQLTFPDGFADAITEISCGATEPYIEETYNEYGQLIAAELHGYDKVRDYLFNECQLMESVILPDTVTDIGAYAFNDCGLTTITLPSVLTTIGDNSFAGCVRLAMTSLPDNLKSIGSFGFYVCTSLALTALPVGVTRIGRNAFANCPLLTLTSLPEGVTMIGQYAFKDCVGITEMLIPSSVETFNSDAFADCTGIVTVEIRGNVYVSSGSTTAFKGCTGLEKVWFRKSCTKVTAGIASLAPFVGCSDTLQIYVENTSRPSGYGTYFNRTGNKGATIVTVVYGQTTRPW